MEINHAMKKFLLFDVNGSFGRTSTGNVEFPTIQSRLDHMDRLGIDFSLVWNAEAKESNAAASNLKLLAELDCTPGTKGRIIPALAVSGLMTYEKDAVSNLKEQMRERKTRALHFVNVYGRMTLLQLEPVICEIRRLKPFLVMRHDETDTQDILDFARSFPDIPIILTEVFWGACIKVFDLMRCFPNILIDTSWLHSEGAIEMVVKHFGPGRIVFGTGFKSHNGAAIASVARAEISSLHREKIAHSNLEKLTGIKLAEFPSNVPACNLYANNRLWQKCIDNLPLGVDIVDSHGHIGPSGGYVLENQTETAQAERAIKIMDKLGINLMIASGMQALMGDPVSGNSLLEKKMAPYRQRIKGYVGFNPLYAKELTLCLDKYFAGEFFIGFKTLCSYWKVETGDPAFQPMWEYADRNCLPILSHTWTENDIKGLKKPVQKYSGAQFLIAHAGGSEQGRAAAEKLAGEYPNVYLEWCGSFTIKRNWEDTLKKVCPQQIVFGTDAMMHDFNWEIGRLLSLDVPEKVLVQILGKNMRRILAMRRK